MFWAKNSYFLAKFGGTPPPPFAGGKLHNNFCGIGGYPRPPPLYGKKLQISIWKVPNSWKELLMMCQKVFATPLGWGMGGVGGQLGRRGIAKYKYIYNHNDTEYMNWKDCFYLMFDLPRIIYFAIFLSEELACKHNTCQKRMSFIPLKKKFFPGWLIITNYPIVKYHHFLWLGHFKNREHNGLWKF